MKTHRVIPIALAGLVLGGAGTATAASSSTATAAASRQVEGKVLSVDRDARTFRLRDSERGTFRIKVTRSTDFERLSGFSALKGQRHIEATIRRAGGRWVALSVERSGGGGNHGGGGGGGADDPAGHH